MQHQEAMNIEKDRARTQDLVGYGLNVIRFTNDEVDYEFDQVCQKNEEFMLKNFTND